jgi:hypothetical protein
MIRDVDVAHAALAAQTIKIEIINLAWTAGVGHIPSSFNAKVILPDGAHAIFICCQGDHKACAGFQSFVPGTAYDNGGCDSRTHGRNL